MKIDIETRQRIKEKDKAYVYCGDTLGPFEIDHVQPRRFGGQGNDRNLALACHRCNQLKGAMSVDRFLERLRQVERGEWKIVANLRGSYKAYSFRKVRRLRRKRET